MIPVYTHVKQCEQQLLQELGSEHFRKLRDLEVQNLSSDFMSMVAQKLNQALGWADRSKELIADVFHTVCWVLGRMAKVQDVYDVMAIGDYITRIHFGKNIGQAIFDFVIGQLELQSLDWSILKDVLSSYEALKNHPAVLKFLKVISLAFSGGILQKLGVESSTMDLWRMVTESVNQILGHTDFIAAAVDLIYFISQRIAAFCSSGDWRSLIHTPKSYSDWVDKAYDILDMSSMLPNLGASGIDYHEYVDQLIETIAQGEEIKRYIRDVEARDGVSQTLSRLRHLYNEILLKDACTGLRMAPFSILVTGPTSTGKSSFEDVLKIHYAKLYNKPLGKGYVYYRTPAEEHWNGFKSSMWCLIIDDIAAINPNTGSEDPSLRDILLGIGNTNFSPPQAAIEDKGKTPFLCELAICSTNTVDLKAHCWFNNPTAVRRRFPYVVEICAKPEYSKEGTNMLDGGKVPPTLPGYYPDLWLIRVYEIKVTPQDTVDKQLILETSNIYEFIQHYTVWTEEHRTRQMGMMASMDNATKVELCPIHKLPNKVCCPSALLEAQVEDVETSNWSLVSKLCHNGNNSTNWDLISKLCLGGAAAYGTYKLGSFAARNAAEVLSQDASLLHHPAPFTRAVAGKMIQKGEWYLNKKKHDLKILCKEGLKKLMLSALYNMYGSIKPLLKTLMIGVGVISSLGITWYFLKQEFPEYLGLREQVNIDEVGKMPTKKSEPENVWRKDDYQPTEFLGRLSQSWSSLGLTKCASIVSKNVVWCRTSHGGNRASTFRALCLGGHLYVVPHHVLPFDEYFDLQIIHENAAEGCNGNIRFKVSQERILRKPELELAFFEVRHMPGRRHIHEVLPKRGFRVDGKGRMIIRNANGSIEYVDTRRTYVSSDEYIEQFNMTLTVCPSYVSRDTVGGECGSPVVVEQPNAVVLAGLHILGGQRRQAVAIPVCYEDYEDAVAHFDTPIVENELPKLENQNFTTVISQRCTARFIPEGDLNVFGSFGGFKRQPKSTVRDTLFTEYLLADGHERKYGPAPMKGYIGLHLGLKAIVQKQLVFKEDVVRKCGDRFINEVMTQLPKTYLEELQHVLPLMAAVNGLPGTKFIDSMNMGTSAGYPYNSSKRNFVVKSGPIMDWQDPVVLTPEIREEVAECWSNMVQGVSSSPIFMQHIKDEPLPMRKVRAGKCRLFMGGPFAWSICVRMALLPFVRVMQLNKYLFECAPGTNATSIEWTRMYAYLTKFGDKRMIAGDFASFDKNMGAMVILEAFRIIRKILEAAGAEKEHLVAVQVIAEDVSFAYTNFNGDLMQFFGSNPSGHPLTVIINCLVNSLYMRYCYHELNPKREVDTFRDNVRLITYGDDNVANSNVDWFNHTAISEVLASVGIEYTMADKLAESVPFIPMSEVSFLKRSFRYEPELDCYLATLDRDSIWRSLMICVPSKTETLERQCVDIVRSAVCEWFNYGRKEFEKQVAYLKKLITQADLECYLADNTFVTWDDLRVRFIKCSEEYLNFEPGTTKNIVGNFEWKYYTPE